MTEQNYTPQLGEAGCTEAPASVTVKVNLRGHDVLFTLRDVSGRALLDKLGPVLDKLAELGATPVGNGNGHGNGAGHGAETRVCQIHNAEMRKREKDGQVWYSHKLADGSYCRGGAS